VENTKDLHGNPQLRDVVGKRDAEHKRLDQICARSIFSCLQVASTSASGSDVRQKKGPLLAVGSGPLGGPLADESAAVGVVGEGIVACAFGVLGALN